MNTDRQNLATVHLSPNNRMEQLNMKTLQDVIDTAERCGSHWFDSDTMRFFNSRLCYSTAIPTSDGSVWFVSSERDGNDPRFYTIRRATLKYTPCTWANRHNYRSWVPSRVPTDEPIVLGMTFDIGTAPCCEFQEFASRNAAFRALKERILQYGFSPC